MKKENMESLINLMIKKCEEENVKVDNITYSYNCDYKGNIVSYNSFTVHTSVKYCNDRFRRDSNSIKNIEDIENNIIQLKDYYNRQKLQYDANNILDQSKNKLESLKEILNNISITNTHLKANYYLCIPYDLLGMLELKKVNKKSITCEDSLGNTVYLTSAILEKLYIENDTIRVYNM